MRQKNLEAVIAHNVQLNAALGNLQAALSTFIDSSGQPFNLEKVISGRDSSVAQVISRIQIASDMILEFNKATRADLIPLQTITQLQSAINDLISHTNNLATYIKSLVSQNGGLNTFDYGNFHANTKNGGTHDTRAQFSNLFDASETFLLRFFENVLILRPRGAFSFQGAANNLASVISEAASNLVDLKGKLKSTNIADLNLKALLEQAAQHVEEIKRLKGDGAADRKTITEHLAEVTQHRSAVQAIHDEAAELENDVKAYQEQFDLFQKQLDSRNSAFVDGTTNLQRLIEDFEAQRLSVEGLITKSKQMLSSATVSGLASNFATMTDKLTSELKYARFAFYLGIFLLALSAVPLLAFVIMPIAAPFLEPYMSQTSYAALVQHKANDPSSGWEYIGQVLARITILLPAAWFVSFAAIRHSSLFRLREHYAYKYSMAVSVEGFKQQAPAYDQEIAALVLEQLAFNPADKLQSSKDIKEGRVPGIAGYLIERIRHRIDKPK